MSEEIFLSIIVPVYNTEKYLQECLESIIESKEINYEIICVNDGSTDNSLLILETYCKKYNHIHIISQKNAGLSEARNTGIKHSKGKYILFLDSDDMLRNGAIDDICIKLKENKEIQILAYDSDCIYENDYLKETEYKDEYYHRKKSYGCSRLGQDMFCEMIENNDFCDSACLMAIDRKWLIENNLFFKSGIIYEDSLFTFCCYMIAKRVTHVNVSYMIYRIRQNSIMQSQITIKNVEGRLETYKEVIKYLIKENCSIRLQQALIKFGEFIYGNLKYAYGNLEIEEKNKINQLSGIEYFCLKGISDDYPEYQKTEIFIYGKGFEEILKNNDCIVIYGAGKLGRLFYEYLRKKELDNKVIYFAVTELDSEKKINGIEVASITNIKKKDALVLICARKDYQREMYKTAQNSGCTNIILLDYRLEQYINLNY